MKPSLKKNDLHPVERQAFSFFPGCSLKASGHENTLSLRNFCDQVNIDLIELDDWNCCGSSSAHSIDAGAADRLPMRNIALAPRGQPLLIACPSCLIRTKTIYLKIKKDPELKETYEKLWETPFDDDLEIIHFFDLFDRIRVQDFIKDAASRLKGLKVSVYYGCMLSRPPDFRFETLMDTQIMEKNLSKLGAQIIPFGYGKQCCGTYLSAAKPKLAEKVVNQIISKAVAAGAECLVTACSMCHLNLEIRSTAENPIPVFHFSELLALALGVGDHTKWFPRHIVDPAPLLKDRYLI